MLYWINNHPITNETLIFSDNNLLFVHSTNLQELPNTSDLTMFHNSFLRQENYLQNILIVTLFPFGLFHLTM
jgi:hypothetical protein